MIENTALWSLIVFAIFVGIFVWDKLPMATSALLACATMVVLGITDFSTAFGQYASSNIFLLMGIMVVGASMQATGVARSFGNIVTRFSKDSEQRIIAISYILSYFLSAFMATSSVLAMFMAILIGMDSETKKLDHRNLIMPLLIGSVNGGISTLVGSTQQLVADGLIQPFGYSMSVFTMAPVGAILGVVGFIYCVFIGYKRGQKIWGVRDIGDGLDIAALETEERDNRKYYTMIAILVYMVVGFIAELFAPAVVATTSGLLCIVTGCLTQKKALAAINWNVLGRLGGVLGLSKILTAAGGIDLLSQWVQNLIGTNVSPFLLFAVCVLLAQVSSYVLFNSTAITLILTFVLAMAEPMNLNPMAYALGITYGASVVFASPLSGTSNQMVMAAGYKFSDFMKYGWMMDLMGYAVIIIFVPLFFPLTLG